MKRSFSVILGIFFICLSIALPTIVLASGACNGLTIVHVGISVPSPSGVSIYFKNETSTPCPDFAVGATKEVYLATTNTDKALAILLTAASLKKKVWAYTTGTSQPYTLAFLQVKDITQ